MPTLLQQLLLTENKKDEARRMIKPMIIQGTYDQEDIEKLMMQRLGIKPATADTYYHMIEKEVNAAKNDGEEEGSNKDEEPEDEFVEEPVGEEIADLEFDEDGNFIGDAGGLEDGQYTVKDNPNRRGIIRRIENAHLIYKRRNESGSFDELWQFNTSDNMQDSLDIKRDILSATDIPYRQTSSEDGSQRYIQKAMGDVQFIEILGLPQ